MASRLRMRRRLAEYPAILLDVDGTLYCAKALRVALALELALSYATRPWRLRELRALRYYRALHNGAVSGAENEQACSDQTARRYGLTQDHLRRLIDQWLEQRPLKYVRWFRNRRLLAAVARQKARGAVIILYSDYPTAQKAQALKGLDPDYQFCAADPAINCFKPDRRGVEHIMATTGFSVADILMIGDRDNKDGAAARAVGMDYLILTGRSRQVRDILRTGAQADGSG